ncbi:flagellar hook-associated protein FlgL [Halanaerobium saccharolyticum]|uniref:flagellar hook-associated protein FlgL n=1 Tax=Halanaerobium saccharolyticum TaxID=43595 RepID=UPI003FCDF09B
MRVTNSMMVRNMLDHLKNNMGDLNDLNEQLSSGKLFQRPSDAPIKVSDSMNYKSQLNRNSQFQRNLNQTENWLNTTESALKSGTEVIQRARELTIYAANDSMTSDDRKMVAKEMKQLRDELIDISNAKLGDSYIFSGQKTGDKPFEVVDNGIGNFVEYQGDDNSISRRLNENVEMDVNLKGSEVFKKEIENINKVYQSLVSDKTRAEVKGSEFEDIKEFNDMLGDQTTTEEFEITVDGVTGTVSFDGDYTGGDSFENFTEVKNDVQTQLDDAGIEAEVDISENNEIIIRSKASGSNSNIKVTSDDNNIIGGVSDSYGSNEPYKGEFISNYLSDMDDSINKYAELRSEVGGKIQRTGNIISRLEANEVHLRSLKSKNEDADLAEVITELKMEETVYRASLASGSRIMQQSLVDFIR